MSDSNDSDVAVLEYRDYAGQWQALAYIGPGRSDGQIDDCCDGSSAYRSCDLRIRYLIR
jgi:hypothetical protein